MEQRLLDEQETNPVTKRPVFLTVLCILTWVGSTLFLALSLYQYITYSALYTDFKEMISRPLYGQSPSLTNSFKWLIWTALIDGACASICAGGSIVMYTRRKWGFYIYLVGQVVPMFLSIYIKLTLGRMNLVSIATMAVWWIVPIGFIIMYALNLKHMRR